MASAWRLRSGVTTRSSGDFDEAGEGSGVRTPGQNYTVSDQPGRPLASAPGGGHFHDALRVHPLAVDSDDECAGPRLAVPALRTKADVVPGNDGPGFASGLGCHEGAEDNDRDDPQECESDPCSGSHDPSFGIRRSRPPFGLPVLL